MKLGLKDKRALVTGSSAGIGQAIAAALIAAGARVCLNARDPKKLEQTARQLGAAAWIPGDLSTPQEGERITSCAIKTLGGLDILVANTGGPAKGDFMAINDQQWHSDFQSLWMSLVESLKVCLPHMKKQRFGRILLVTSIAAREPLPDLTTSNGLRAGLAGLAKSVARECAADGVTVNTILPGYTATDRLKALKLSEEKIKDMVPAGRLGDPCEIGHLAAFLASERASYITGQSIAVDGGVLKSF